MIKHRSLYLLFFLVSSITFSHTAFAAQGPYGAISGAYLQQVYDARQSNSPSHEEAIEHPLTANEVRAIAFQLFKSTGSEKKDSGIASRDAWSDLEFSTLFSKINRSVSGLGEAALLEKLLLPTTSKTVITKRQAAIRKIVADKEIFAALDRQVVACAQVEDFVLAPWGTRDSYLTARVQGLYFDFWRLKELNYNPLALEISLRQSQLSLLFYLTGGVAGEITNAIGRQNHNLGLFETLQAASADVKNLGFIQNIQSLFTGQATWRQAVSAGSSMWNLLIQTPYLFSMGVKDQKALYRSFMYTYMRLIGLAEFLKNLKQLALYVETCVPELKGALDEFASIKKLFAYSGEIGKEVQGLLELLKTSTFEGEPTIVAFTGRVLAANKMLDEVKHYLIPALRGFGEIDAFLSMARLVREHTALPAQFSFAEFVEQDAPYFEFEGFWNPVINPKKAVLNSLALGRLVPQNAIVTGANAGGKSTMLRAVTLGILLAQSFGVVPAKKAVMTIYSKVNTYFSVEDNLALGNSFFMAEVLRAKEVLRALIGLKPGEKAFLAMDEMFTGTSPYEAMVACYAFCTLIAQCKNASCMLATHFKLLTKLETTHVGIFKNIAVDGVVNADDSITYPYLVHDGTSKENVAFAMLRREGVLTQSELDAAIAIAEKV